MPVPYRHRQIKERENERWNKEKLKEHAEDSAFLHQSPEVQKFLWQWVCIFLMLKSTRLQSLQDFKSQEKKKKVLPSHTESIRDCVWAFSLRKNQLVCFWFWRGERRKVHFLGPLKRNQLGALMLQELPLGLQARCRSPPSWPAAPSKLSGEWNWEEENKTKQNRT